MKLTKSVDFALRVLTALAREKGPMTMPDLSEKLDISYNHLSKIIQKLRRSGLVKTQQGKFGGVCLDVDMSQISLKKVVDLLDGPTTLAACLDLGEGKACGLDSDCRIKHMLFAVQANINKELEAVSLAQLV